MKNEIDKKVVFTSLIWKYLERGSVQGISFFVSIILARLLSPSDYGVVVIITVFINIANVFVQNGFNMALIQKDEVKEEDYSSVFFISFTVSILLYIVIYIGAPLLADFYRNDLITNVIRVLALTLPFGALNSIQNAILIRRMDFKRIFRNNLFAVSISGTLGVVLAYRGLGVWALVGQQLSNIIAVCFVMWFTVKWRPMPKFSIIRVGRLFCFGWKILISSLIDTLYDQLYSLVVGKLYTSSELAYFNKGQEFPRFVVINIDSSIESVMLPTYAKYQKDKIALKKVLRKAITLSSYVVFPVLFGILGAADSIVRIVLTEKWIECVPFVQIYCLALLFHPINIANMQAINAMGRSEITLKVNILKKSSAVLVLIISIKFGLYFIAVGAILNGIIFVILNTSPNRNLLNYGIKEQLKDVIPSLVMSAVMGILVLCISYFEFNIVLKLSLQIVIGAFAYWLMSIIFHNNAYQYLKKLVSEFF